jgi:hypothetical protein
MAKTKISEFNANPALNTDIDSINIAEGCSPSGINDAIRELMSQLKDWQAGTSNDPMVIGSSGSLTLNQGTANGVTYLNGSKVVTSGSALTFDGTTLTSDSGSGGLFLALKSSNTNGGYFSGYSSGTAVWDIGTAKQTLNTGGASDLGFNTRSGSMMFGINNSEQMRLTSTGLGIGTSSPSQKLEVVGAIRGTVTPSNSVQASMLLANSATTSAANLQLNTSGGLAFWTFQNGGAGWFNSATLDSSGNLGLGVTPTTGGYGKGFQISGDPASDLLTLWIQPINTNDHRVSLTNNAKNTGVGTWGYAASSQSATMYQQVAGEHQWHAASTGTAGNAITFTQAMTLDASGNLLVGTTSAFGKLTVSAPNSGDAANITAFDSTSRSTHLRIGSYSATGAYGVGVVANTNYASTADTSLSFYTTGSSTYAERARIDSSGNLLVGTTSTPSSTVSGVQISNANQTRFSFGSYTGAGDYIYFINGNGTVGKIASNGSTTSYNTSSDYRLKNTIAPMTGALAKVAQLKPVTYKWNADGSDGQGFIAHELAEVVPDAVTGEKDAVDAEGNPQYQGIDVSFLVATLTAAIKEQQAIIESLKARLDAANL